MKEPTKQVEGLFGYFKAEVVFPKQCGTIFPIAGESSLAARKRTCNNLLNSSGDCQSAQNMSGHVYSYTRIRIHMKERSESLYVRRTALMPPRKHCCERFNIICSQKQSDGEYTYTERMCKIGRSTPPPILQVSPNVHSTSSQNTQRHPYYKREIAIANGCNRRVRGSVLKDHAEMAESLSYC